MRVLTDLQIGFAEWAIRPIQRVFCRIHHIVLDLIPNFCN